MNLVDVEHAEPPAIANCCIHLYTDDCFAPELPGANWSGSSRPVTSEGCYSQEDWIVRTLLGNAEQC